MRESGLKLLIGDEERVRCGCAAPTIPPSLGPRILSLFASRHSITGVIEAMQRAARAANAHRHRCHGIPTGISTGNGGRYEGSTLESIDDPGGRQWRELTPQRAIDASSIPQPRSRRPG
jgi:2-dehydropantoate 2-reductase